MATAEQGLFSLVEAASASGPIATNREPSTDSLWSSGSYKGPSSLGGAASSIGNSSKAHTAMKHRRLSSTGQARRRLSEAREANSRPSPGMLQTAASTLSSLATMSLSGSPPPQSNPQTGTSLTSASGIMSSLTSVEGLKAEAKDDDSDFNDPSAAVPIKAEINGGGISVTKTGKKRGTIFKCESCSKVYRHPSCLIKHRWEHSPHWREASKFLLSKHQQVQLLEAAAILSHLSPSASGGSSLPEDRSLWPSFLSGGTLPPPDQANISHDVKPPTSSVSTSLDQPVTYPTSSSMPATSLLSSSFASGPGSGSATSTGRSPSAGPRMHDYAIPGSGGLTQVRPGVVGVPTNSRSQSDVHEIPIGNRSSMSNAHPAGQSSTHHRSAPMPVPTAGRDSYREPQNVDGGAYSFVSGASVSDAWGSPVSVGFAQSSFRSSVGSVSASASYSAPGLGHSFSDGASGWSLPRSSLRSGSLSRSRSGSVDMDMDEDAHGRDSELVDVGDAGGVEGAGQFGFTSRAWKNEMGNGKIEEEWDGMEMEMEM